MSFSLKIGRDNANNLREIMELHIWQRVTYADNSKSVIEIFPKLIPLSTTLSLMRAKRILLKQRSDKHIIYKLNLYNEVGLTIDRDVGDDFYFQFIPDNSDHMKLTNLKNIEFSLDQNFTQNLTNLLFHRDYSFQKITDTNYSFNFLAEDGTKYYERSLKPFAVDFPKNKVFKVHTSFENLKLSQGLYVIDGVKYFFDSDNEVLPKHFVLKVTV